MITRHQAERLVAAIALIILLCVAADVVRQLVIR